MTHHKISASTLARTAALALALTNQVLSAVGKPIRNSCFTKRRMER